MNHAGGPLLVIGLGNVLLRDDGVGVRVAEELRRLAERDPDALPRGTRVLDGGTLGLGLLPHLEDARALVLVDAVDLGLAPGAVTVLHADEITTTVGGRGGSSPGGLAELISTATLLGSLPAAISLVGVQVGEIAVDLSLSPRVQAALPVAVETVRRESRSLVALAGRPSALPRVAAGLAGARA